LLKGFKARRHRFQDHLFEEVTMVATRPTFGAFNQGEIPTIACFNKATLLGWTSMR